MSAFVDRRRAKMPSLKPCLEALPQDWRPRVAPRATNLAALAREVFAQQRRRDSAWPVATRAPAHLLLDACPVRLRALIGDLIVPAWHTLAHYGGGRIEIGEVLGDAARVCFVHDESSHGVAAAPLHAAFIRERSAALQRAAAIVRGWGGRICWSALPGRRNTVLFTAPPAA